MGCICSKGGSGSGTNCVERESIRSKKLGDSSRSGISVDDVENGGCDAATALLIPSKAVDDSDTRFVPVTSPDDAERKPLVSAVVNPHLHLNGGGYDQIPEVVKLPKKSVNASSAFDAPLVIDQWPPWLSAVAGEAIRGWAPRKANSFEKLDKIGQGTYSSVYRARDLDTGKLVALKKVRFANMDPESVRFMAREILLLRRLDHPNVMKLEGLITSRTSGSLYLVFEYMEHDLAGLQAAPGVKFTEPQIKCFMRQLLCGLDHCHSRRVLHRDIKGANLLLDNNANLKIADFGLATLFNPRKCQPLTSRVVTLWYRPPELLLGSTEYGVAVDLWSAGCILAELFTGKPIMPGRTEVEQLHKIFKLCGSPSEEYWRNSKLPHATIFKPQQPYRRRVSEIFKELPPSALALLEVLLAIEPESRRTASAALHSEFFLTEPLPCDPSSLPRYPPSKEFDAKLRNEEARRRRGDAGDPCGQEADQRLRVEPTDLNESQWQMHKKTDSGKYDADGENRVSFPIPPRGKSNSSLRSSHSVHPASFGSSRIVNEEGRGNQINVPDLRSQRSFMVRGAPQLSRLPSLVGVRGSCQSQWSGESFNAAPSLLKAGSTRHLPDTLDSSQQNGGHRLEKDPMGYGPEKKRVHCSGPLLPLGGNTDSMLREHEKEVQHAVRRARNGKFKTSRFIGGDSELDESLLHHASSGR
uniref:Protein kinase domain-containing protein n=1 Tax=Kalanchoe fedtschenkoi TaxID=63787 RepID=A0A7N0TXU3_KALFE